MPATISPASGALGNKETTAVTPYVVSALSGTTITQIVERINGVITNTVNNPASLSRTLTAPQATWDALAYFGTHTATVTVTDSGGGQTVATYTFVKRLANNASLLEAAKANTDARARISTKRDALATQVGLPAGSTFDAISAQLTSGVIKKSASGTVSDSAAMNFVDYNGNITSRRAVVVSGLGFKPSEVIVRHTNGTFEGVSVSLGQNPYNGFIITTNLIRITGNAYISNDGFCLPVGDLASSYTWVAIGI